MKTRIIFVAGHDLNLNFAGVRSVAIARDGRRVVSGGGCDVVVWDFADDECTNTILKEHAAAVTSVAIRANGLCVASGSKDGKVYVWLYEKGAWVAKELEGHKEGGVQVTVCEKLDRVISEGKDGSVAVWDLVDGKWSKVWLSEHAAAWVHCVSISRDGQRIASGSHGKTVRLWDWNGTSWKMSALQGHTDRVTCVGMSEARVVFGSGVHTLQIWNFEGGEWQASNVIERPDREVKAVVVDEDGCRIRAIDWYGGGPCYVQRDYTWEEELNSEDSGDARSEPFGMVRKDKWPYRIADVNEFMCSDVRKAADGAYFVVQHTEPYFSFVRTVE